MTEPVERAVREALAANDLTFWSASGAHVFNGETAIRDFAHSLEARLSWPQAEPETKPKRDRIRWSDVVIDEGDEAP